MKCNIEDIKDSFKIGIELYQPSRVEADEVWNMYHNRHYSSDQLAVLQNRGQPAETFNVIKLFARMLVGYYSTIVNTAVIRPRHPRHQTTATVLNDVVNFTFEQNRFDIEGDKIKLGGLISGILCSYTDVKDSGARDEFNRPIHEIKCHSVPDYQLVLDPSHEMDDYSDARFLHRFKWMTEEEVIKLFGKEVKDKLEPYNNFLGTEQSEYWYQQQSYFGEQTGYSFMGNYRVFDNYLVVHTVLEDDEGKRWSVFWHDNTILKKTEITTKACRWPYRVQTLHSSNKTEFYGIFREVRESQNAINQALLQVQLMANSTKVLVQEGAVENIEEFKSAINRVNGVIPVLDLSKVKIEQLSRDMVDQYVIIDKALDRIQRVLGINDSFLGMAYASDSGRKVKLQQSATIMSLRYITARIESFYQSLAMDFAKLAQQYYKAHQFLLLTDAMTGQRWVELNKPMEKWSGQFDSMGQPIMEPILAEVLSPEDGEPMEDEEGNLIFAPVTEENTDMEFTQFNVVIESSSYNDEDEKGQLLLESVMSGNIGQMMAQIDPAKFFKVASLALKTAGTKYSPQMAQIMDELSQQLNQDPQAQMQAQMLAQGGGSPEQAMSQALKLPQNTNEGI